MNNPLVSIVVPVYNAKPYLHETIELILAQTYENIEIIMVDDGSTDGSGDVCEEYRKRDYRVVVLHTQNGGVSSARNKGVSIATGEYISFIDSDDVIQNDYIEHMIDVAAKTNEDIVICRYMVGNHLTKEHFFSQKQYGNPKYEVIPISKYRYTNKYRHPVIWGGYTRQA